MTFVDQGYSGPPVQSTPKIDDIISEKPLSRKSETYLIGLTKIHSAALKLHSLNTEVEMKFVFRNNGMKTNEENIFSGSVLPLLCTSMLLVRLYF